MKTFITFTKTNIFTITVLVVAFAPLTYALSQSTQTDNTESKDTFSISKEIKEEVTLIPILRARLGVIQTINNDHTFFTIQIENKKGDTTLIVETTATTTVYFGDGKEANISYIDTSTKVYVFGYITSDHSKMVVSKIVLAKK